ncbi:MAG: NAD-dependent epimerase/dehydratase family protein [Phycisphaerales bacterium]
MITLPPLPSDATTYEGRHACVTGGAGFIGSHLVEALVARGAEVSVVDDLSNGSVESFASVRSRVRFVEGSILDRAALDAAIAGCDVVFHEAALGSVPGSVDDPVRYVAVDATGTLEVLEACRRHGVRRVVYAGSSSAYGDAPESPKVETMAVDPLSPYAAAKLAGEHLVRSYAHCYGLEALTLRYFNVFGRRQRADSPYSAVIPRFADALRAGRRPVIFGTGEQTRDFVHVANVAWANLLAGATSRPLRGGAVNIGGASGISLRDLLERMAAVLRLSPETDHRPPRAGDVMHSTASIAAAEATIGYRPVVSFDEGLRDLLAA